MRILHLDCGERMQGGQWQVLYLLRGLRARGHRNVLLAEGELARRARAEGFDVRGAGSFPPSDIIHAHDAHSHALAAWRDASRLVVSRRVAFAVKRNWLSRLKYRRAAHYIAVSRFVAATLVEAGLKPERISVVYDGVPIPEPLDPLFNGPVLGVLKDPLSGLLVEAARVAGVEVIDAANLAESLKRASAMAYITGLQGLGSAVLAAMAAGVPVIASRVGGLPEAVDHDRTGLLVDNRIESIAPALQRITTDPGLVLRLTREARGEALARFSVDTMVEGTLRVYERLLG